jgi:murein DD-endopeptidase MepM/ murein hydrolase activator NlpD
MGKAGAIYYMSRMLPQWANFRNWGDVVFELCNEPACNGETELRALNDFTIEALRIATQEGYTCCAMNLPEGNPGGDPAGGEADERAIRWKLEFLVGATKAILAGGHYWGQHAYWFTPVEGPTGDQHAWRILRNMRILGKIGVDCAELKVLLSEAGLDGKIGGKGDANGGWQANGTLESYIEEVAQFEAKARVVSQVKAYFLFDVGYFPPWASYDHSEEVLKRIATRLDQIAVVPPSVAIRLLYPVPLQTRITQIFGENPADYAANGLAGHNGIDWSVVIGTPIRAANAGTVMIGHQWPNYGTYLTVENADWATLYGHLSQILVKDRQQVRAGQVIALSGNSGRSTGPHLHFGLWRNKIVNPGYNQWFNPSPYLVAPDLPYQEAATSPAVLADKLRWWTEQAVRAYEAKDYPRFESIMYDLIDAHDGLHYRLERRLKDTA